MSEGHGYPATVFLDGWTNGHARSFFMTGHKTQRKDLKKTRHSLILVKRIHLVKQKLVLSGKYRELSNVVGIDEQRPHHKTRDKILSLSCLI